jgi:hypothetical protein
MTFDADAYWQQVGIRNPTKIDHGKSWKCFCCKDTGIVDPHLLKKHYQRDLAPAVSGYRCDRPRCNAAAGYPSVAFETIGADACQWLHEQAAIELSRDPPDPKTTIAEIRTLNFSAVPKPSDRPIDRILADDPDGRRIADYDDF